MLCTPYMFNRWHCLEYCHRLHSSRRHLIIKRSLTHSHAADVSPVYPRLLPAPTTAKETINIADEVAAYDLRTAGSVYSSITIVLIDPSLPVYVPSAMLDLTSLPHFHWSTGFCGYVTVSTYTITHILPNVGTQDMKNGHTEHERMVL